MKIIAAPNSFKESLTAIEIASIIKETLEKVSKRFEVVEFPVGDGGDGTLEAVVYSTTYGTGELIKLAAQTGVNEIILGVGGSATVDGGIGALTALGFKFLDENGDEVPPNGEGLVKFRKIIPPEVLPQVKIRIAVDVMNPLLGERGAVRVYGPQKGLKPEYFDLFEAGLKRLRDEILKLTGKDINIEGAGAAGGIAGSFYGLLDARIESGIELVLETLRFDELLRSGANLVITGEGKLDYQTLFGKAPFGVAKHAHKAGIPVIALAGAIEDEDKLIPYFDALFSIVRGPVSLTDALKNAGNNLKNTVRSLGKVLSMFEY